MDTIIKSFLTMPLWEFMAVLLGIVYIVLAGKENKWSWVFGFFSTLIYTLLFWEGALISSSLLNFYYMFMAVYGFILWQEEEGKENHLKMISWRKEQHIIVIFGGLFFSLFLGYLSTRYLDANFAYIDATVMVFSIIATWMLAKKILENWLYWMMIDSLAIWLYWQTGYTTTVVLFCIYIILSIYGYREWRKVFNGRV